MKKMTAEERIYVMKVAELDCCLCGRGPDGNPPHHPVGGGTALKSPHWDVIPMCHECHDALHMHNGRFKTMKKLERRQWESDMTKATKKVLGHEHE